MPVSEPLSGRRVLVTGAGQGLGRAYALDAARRGAVVAVNDIDAATAADTAAEIGRRGGRAVPVVGSVGAWEDAAAVVAHAVEELAGLDGLVCNAGVFDVQDPWDTGSELVQRMIGVNVIGTIATGVAAMPHLPPGGSIVTVISGAAGGMSGMAVYGATKGAVLALTMSWAIDLAPRRVRVNAVSPLAETRLTEIGRRRLGATPPQPPADRVAPLVSFLLSPLSGDVTGRVFRVDANAISLMSNLVPVASRPRGGLPDFEQVEGDVAALLEAVDG